MEFPKKHLYVVEQSTEDAKFSILSNIDGYLKISIKGTDAYRSRCPVNPTYCDLALVYSQSC